MNVKKTDERFLARDLPAEDIEVVKSENSILIDATGKRYIDFLTGWCVGNLGWGNKEIRKKRNNYNGPDYVLPSYRLKAWAELAELLAKITPGKLQKSFRATGGTEAVEIALQAAMSYTKRDQFVSVEGAYHGHSIGAMSVGSSEFRNWYRNLLPNCHKIRPPLDDNAAKQLETILKKRKVAAFIMEPVICNLGVEIPTKAFMQRAQTLCKKYGTLLIMDEVATGFGRTGKLFASQHFDLTPDILCIAKGVSGGYGALGATITTPEVAKAMEYSFSNYSTYGWHPWNTEGTIASLKYLLRHQKHIEQNTEKMNAYFTKRLSHMAFKSSASIRAKGLAIGVQFKKAGYAAAIAQRAQTHGVLVAPLDDQILTLFPALTIDPKTAKEGLDRLEKSI